MEKNKKGWIFWKDNSPHTKLAVNPAMLSGAMSLETLVRELIQNSADASAGQSTVKMVVSDGHIERSKIYDALCLDDLRKHIQGTIDFASSGATEKRIVPKSRGQLDLLAGSKYRYLKFSDYGTKGMRGVQSYDKDQAFWKLLFQEGTSDKDTDSAGGVGVGKNATFPFSDIATVLYVTKTDEGFGLAGSAHLASSVIDGQNYEMDGNLITYAGTDADILDKGDFSTIKPIGLDDVKQIGLNEFDRTENGSDVIILGTDGNAKLSDKEWPYLFAVYAIKNFFVAFLNGRIELVVKSDDIKEDIVINSETCQSVLDSIQGFGDNVSPSLSNLVAEAQLAVTTYKGKPNDEDFAMVNYFDPVLGDIDLFLNRSKDVAAKQWCVCRSFGMRTTTQQVRVQKPTFAIAVIKSKEGSDYLLKAEAGNHTEYDFSAMGENGQAAKRAVGSFEQWAKNEIFAFGKIDSTTTDIELAGFANYISLEEEVKTGDENGGTKPLLEIIPQEKPAKRSKPKLRKRNTDTPDPEQEGGTEVGTEQWNHNPNSHHKWNDERNTRKQNETEGADNSKSYERTINVSATFRDIHEPFGDTVEIIGLIRNKAYKTIDLLISAVDEQSKINSTLPPIAEAEDHDTGAKITLGGPYILKDVPVNELSYIHIDVRFSAPFRAMLLESGSVKQTIEIDDAEPAATAQEENANESTK